MVALIPGGVGLEDGGFFAMSPLENSVRLFAGLNALITPASTAGETYTELFTQLTNAATDGQAVHTDTLSSWNGTTSLAAKNRFGLYTTWLRGHAATAQTAAGQMAAISAAQGVALSTMPAPPIVLAALAKMMAATVAAANPTTAVAGSVTLAESEAEWNALRLQAGGSMTTYDGTTAPVLASMPPLTTSPSTVNGGGPGGLLDDLFSNNGTLLSGGNGSVIPVSGGGGGAGGAGGAGGGSPLSGGGTSLPGGGNSSLPGGGSDPSGSLPSGSLPTNPGGSSLPTPNMPDGVDRLDATYPGTSSNSAALAALASGLGVSGVGIGMSSGGPAELAGKSTSFRMPGSWPANSATESTEETAAEEQPTAPRGAVAPSAGRRRDDEEQRQRAGVPISQLEEVDGDETQPGVIEYVDDEA